MSQGLVNLLILPNTLFDVGYIRTAIKNINIKIIIWEHPQYFTTYKYNKKRLVLHRASMKYYAESMEKYYEIKYVDFKTAPKLTGPYHYFDPVDRIDMPDGGQILESPNFLLSVDLLKEYRKKTRNFFFNGFYMWAKAKLNIIPELKSQDMKNRKLLPADEKIPPQPTIGKPDKDYIKDAEEYVNKHFPNNYGNVDGLEFPVTRETAQKWLKSFLATRLKKFGDYQDYTSTKNSYLFHSCLSSSMNIGLLNPLEIISAMKKIKSKVPINSYEGIIRQYFWREYQRYCYTYLDEWFSKDNYFNHKKRLSAKWYNGTTGIGPVDDAIKDAFNTGYLHHIRRLMIVANYMNLCGIHHKYARKWFIEFSLDSYDWVMYQNLDMGFFASGGKTSRKPYISSSNYVKKMSNYKAGPWSEKWDELYNKFIATHKDKLWKYRYHFPTLYAAT